MLENPEAHIHPAGQSKLGELLARAAADGIQIIVETHSDHILNGIRLAAKTQILHPEDIQIMNFANMRLIITMAIETIKLKMMYGRKSNGNLH